MMEIEITRSGISLYTVNLKGAFSHLYSTFRSWDEQSAGGDRREAPQT